MAIRYYCYNNFKLVTKIYLDTTIHCNNKCIVVWVIIVTNFYNLKEKYLFSYNILFQAIFVAIQLLLLQ